MNVTEVLVNGFDGEKTVFIATLTPGVRARVVTVTDEGESTAVETVSEAAMSAFTTVRQVIDDLLTVGPARV